MTDMIDKLDGLRAAALREVDDNDWLAWDEEILKAWPGIARVLRAAKEYKRELACPDKNYTTKDYTLVRRRREQLFEALDALNKEAK